MALPKELENKLFILRLADINKKEVDPKVFMVSNEFGRIMFAAMVLDETSDSDQSPIVEVWTPGSPAPDSFLQGVGLGQTDLYSTDKKTDKPSDKKSDDQTEKPSGLKPDTSLSDLLLEAYETMKPKGGGENE